MTHHINIRVPDEIAALLDQQEREGVSRSQIINEALAMYFEKGDEALSITLTRMLGFASEDELKFFIEKVIGEELTKVTLHELNSGRAFKWRSKEGTDIITESPQPTRKRKPKDAGIEKVLIVEYMNKAIQENGEILLDDLAAHFSRSNDSIAKTLSNAGIKSKRKRINGKKVRYFK